MKSGGSARGRLQIRRETLRVLGSDELAAAAGAGPACPHQTGEAQPKSNAWTGGTFDLETALVCTATSVG